MVYAILALGGFGVGLVLGRWWALLAAVAVGLWIGVSEEVEVLGWFLGLVYGVLVGVAIAAGVLIRGRFRTKRG